MRRSILKLRKSLVGWITLSLLLWLTSAARADDGFTFTSIDFPGAAFTFGRAINPAGEIVGWYCQKADCAIIHGFLRSPEGSFTQIDVPVAGAVTFALGINPAGAIVGGYTDSVGNTHAYVLNENGGGGDDDQGDVHTPPRFTSFDVPGFTSTTARGINPRGDIVGFYCCDSSGNFHGLLRHRDGTLTKIDVPNAVGTVAMWISPEGEIVGIYADTSGNNHGFLRSPDGKFTTIDVPFGVPGSTNAFGINPNGQIVGCYGDAKAIVHGFVRSRHGTFTIIDVPVPNTVATIPFGINPGGEEIVGEYDGADGSAHGFLLSHQENRNHK